ncbi:ATP-binding protein [Pseudorhodobacter turbinis]|uniref:ATP-binding protein n=1 Tax=Pseudorhodobacter turbinis TaxID=2500533 RepID=A0A4P8EG24_9RHOB|nr:ATP-binding protein [Pseudorhodobacter turbinis]QCO55662.1 ATP-binding protein [Pseudorhodobacter turbinis]
MKLVFESNLDAVRTGLADLLASDALCAMEQDARGAAEIVLAEVFNNVVEHAYATSQGKIEVCLKDHPEGVLVTVTDSGIPFPQQQLPQGLLPEVKSSDDLPEGGFGWYLIRSQVRHLAYRREGKTNHLTFCLPYKAAH